MYLLFRCLLTIGIKLVVHLTLIKDLVCTSMIFCLHFSYLFGIQYLRVTDPYGVKFVVAGSTNNERVAF